MVAFVGSPTSFLGTLATFLGSCSRAFWHIILHVSPQNDLSTLPEPPAPPPQFFIAKLACGPYGFPGIILESQTNF